MPNRLLQLVLLLVVIGLVAWLIGFVPIPAPFGTIIWVALVIAAVAALVYFVLGCGPWKID